MSAQPRSPCLGTSCRAAGALQPAPCNRSTLPCVPFLAAGWRLTAACDLPAAAAGFLLYAAVVLAATVYLIYGIPFEQQTSSVFPYVAICSIVGSLSVVSCKALGVALKLTFEGDNQLVFPPTYAFLVVVAACVVTQMNYLNKALDLFSTAIVTPIYYVGFTSFTITANMIMFREKQVRGTQGLFVRGSGGVAVAADGHDPAGLRGPASDTDLCDAAGAGT